jgi:hypothetical protein
MQFLLRPVGGNAVKGPHRYAPTLLGIGLDLFGRLEVV